MAHHPIARRCGRCGAFALFGFGPPHGKSGPRIHACEDHVADAEQWWRERYDRQPLRQADPHQSSPARQVSETASDPRQPTLI